MQLPLRLTLRDDARFENYVTSNLQLIDVLQTFSSRKDEPFLYLYGQAGSGRSHLLQACCHVAQQHHYSAFYFSLRDYHAVFPTLFENMEQCAVVCLDDVDAIMGQREWEEALFHFYNRARNYATRLLVSASVPPQQLTGALRDLQSRLAWGLVLEIPSLNDHEKLKALQIRAMQRGLVLSDEVGQYLFHHHSRNLRDLCQALDRLDQASLIEKRRITIPFVKSVIY